ncbi:hypothetical protein Ae201684P_000967 [Aphanomyces euteiches]|nr:hypothetical protein Ae201684P_000967 [Aphanomyces euteiches]
MATSPLPNHPPRLGNFTRRKVVKFYSTCHSWLHLLTEQYKLQAFPLHFSMSSFLPSIVSSVGQHFVVTHHAALSTGIQVEYTLHGNPLAPHKLILVCGLAMPKEAFHPIVHAITTKAFDHVQILAFDNRGVGGSDAPWTGYSTHLLALDALALMDHLKWQTAHVFGTSLGGMIAMEMAHAAPSRVLSLSVAVTTAGYLQGTTSVMENLRCLAGVVAQMLMPKSGEERIRSLLRQLYPDSCLQDHSDLFFQYHAKRGGNAVAPLQGFIGHQLAVLCHNMSLDRLHAIRDAGFPILVVGAAQDVMMHPSHSHWLARAFEAPHTRFIQFQDAGHGVYTQCADALTNQLLMQFQLLPARSL